MADVTEALTGKLGPAPVWVWAAGVSVPLIGWRLWSAHRAAAAAAKAEADANQAAGSNLDTAPDSLLPGASGAVAAGALYPTGNPGGLWNVDDAGSVGTNPTGPVDNYAWINAAADRLVAQGYAPSVVLSALRKVIDGQPVTDQEEAIFNLAVRGSGNPPGGVPTITRAGSSPVVSSPTTPAGPAPIDTTAAQAAEAARLAAERAYNDNVNAQLAAAAAANRSAGVQYGTPYDPSPVATAPAPTAAPAPVAAPTVTVNAGETMYALIHRVTGHNPSVAEIKQVAAINGLHVGPAPAYNITPWRTGQAVRLS